ncbi:DMT family transporter [uncultured Devosia sp.]|uniref:DMT family transporter n=1 Tax=uncultured Devosia sp. TaxID=211434 RepID=UPI0035C9EEC0
MSTLIAPVEERHNSGIGILLLSQLILIFLDTSAKWMSTQGIPTGEIVFIRYAVHVALILAIVWPLRGRALFSTANWKLEVLRGICLLATTGGNFLAMRYLPLTITGALIFTSPLMVCALSGPLLGETIGWRRWLAILAGFIGILIIVRPGTEAFQPASLLGLAAAFFVALFSIITRKLAGVDTAMTQQFYAGAVALVIVTPVAFTGWTWPSDGITWLAFFGAGTVGMTGHVLISVAHRFAPPSTLAPFNYLTLLYLALVSWIVFSQPPDAWFFLGAGIIILSGLYIWLRERALNKRTTSVDEAILD